MRILSFSLLLFLYAFIVHWVVWRISLPKRQSQALFIIFMAVLGVGLTAPSFFPFLAEHAPQDVLDYIHVVLFHIPATLGYIATYSALEGESPSISMVKFVAESGEIGRDKSEFTQIINQSTLIDLRIEAMIQNNWMIDTDGQYQLTPKGEHLARLFATAQKLLGIQGGG